MDQAKPTHPARTWHSREGHHSSPAKPLKFPLFMMSIFAAPTQSWHSRSGRASLCGRRIPRGFLQSIADAQDTITRFSRARNKDAKAFAWAKPIDTVSIIIDRSSALSE
ncbi:hypothetical protein GBZ26_21370 [Azospirillum formosense]|uniref:Transposase n=1 Tax=Azospirillum formosense TaxID=861533 RepID=A0ABX2KYI2_9PROT|nr:hypothetical protein [Azospirillum formosense]MBY3756979.1 hypothetical protein [Azospirillum formosense]NUB21728.1 hypothetical protein [Azospirillum formosense]